MRFRELENKTDKEQNEMILFCPKYETKEILDNPKLLEGKVLVFRGNYDGYATKRLCARTIEYLSSKERWKVSDVILHEMFRTEFAYHFTREELEDKFRAFCEAKGFLMDL